MGIQLLSLCLYMTLKKLPVITILQILGVDMLIQTTACLSQVLHIFEGTENEQMKVVC